jgi:hypothetical protein
MRQRDIVRLTLQWINRVRASHGLDELSKIEKGRCRESTRCPISRSLAKGLENSTVSTGGFSAFISLAENDDPVRHDLPRSAQFFISAFDRGFLPEFNS